MVRTSPAFPLRFTPACSHPRSQSRVEYLSLTGLRADGRRPNETRRIRCRMGVLERADGSAYYEQGNTKVLVSVMGPQEVTRRSDAQHDTAVVTVDFT